MSLRAIREGDKAGLHYNIIQQQKKKSKKKGKRNCLPKPLCNLCLHSSSNPPLLHIEPLPISRIPMAAQFLTSAPCCCTLGVGHDFSGPQCTAVNGNMYYTHYLAAVQKATTTEWLFPLPSSRHTSYPSRALPLPLSQTFPGLSRLLLPFVFSIHTATNTLTVLLYMQVNTLGRAH